MNDINSSSLLGTLKDSNKTKEDQYICDRNAYNAGRHGKHVEYSTQREQDMYQRGATATDALGNPA